MDLLVFVVLVADDDDSAAGEALSLWVAFHHGISLAVANHHLVVVVVTVVVPVVVAAVAVAADLPCDDVSHGSVFLQQVFRLVHRGQTDRVMMMYLSSS